MDALQVWAGQAEWAMKNLAYNLDFIPDDKLNWKPAPEANSALEVAHHLVGAFMHLLESLRKSNGEADVPEAIVPPKPTTREEAKQQLLAALKGFLDLVHSVKPEKLGEIIDTPMGQMPFWFLLGMPVCDAIHHHGQIAYLQTLLGDEESHFDMSLMPA